MSNKLIFIGLILIFGALLRFVWLERVPHSINGDQLHYLLSSKSFVLTGKDITQAVNPFELLLFRYPPTEMVQAELPYFLDMSTVGWMPFSLAANALPNSILSLLIIVLIYLITKKLFNDQVAIIASFISAINPLFIAMGRTSYELITATFFYLLAFYVLLKTKGWKILLSLPIFLLAFYSYIATKVIFLPIIFVFCLLCYFVINKKNFAKQYVFLSLLAILFVVFYFLQIKSSPQTDRISELLLPTSPIVAEQVNHERKITLNNPLLSVFENKITTYSKILTTNTLHTISTDYLFLHSDNFFMMGKHGLFYPLDLVFLVAGIILLYSKNKRLFLFLISLSAISIIPQIIHSQSAKTGNFSPHIVLLIPFLIIIIAYGIWQTIDLMKKHRKIFAICIAFLYIILTANFLNIYFFQMPLQPNFYNFPNRILSHYLSLSDSDNKKIMIYTPDPRGKFQEYLFYTNSYNKNTAQSITNSLQKNDYKIGNISFLSCNTEIKNVKNKDTAITHFECGMSINGDHHSIAGLSDSNKIYEITNDKLCSKYNLKPYISGLSINDLNIDNMSTQKFCQTFIIAI